MNLEASRPKLELDLDSASPFRRLLKGPAVWKTPVNHIDLGKIQVPVHFPEEQDNTQLIFRGVSQTPERD